MKEIIERLRSEKVQGEQKVANEAKKPVEETQADLTAGREAGLAYASNAHIDEIRAYLEPPAVVTPAWFDWWFAAAINRANPDRSRAWCAGFLKGIRELWAQVAAEVTST
jgi:hypothetical protein